MDTGRVRLLNQCWQVLFAILCALSYTLALAESVQVENAWVRATVPGQRATGAFMELIASEDTRLVSAITDYAGYAEVHEMHLDGDVMRMRAVPDGLALPAGQRVALRPGALHLMLMELKKPVSKGSSVGMTLVFRNARGVEQRLAITLPATMTAPTGAAR